MIYLGVNLVKHIIDVINNYKIGSKVGYFVIDNASNDDIMVETLSTCIYKLFIYL